MNDTIIDFLNEAIQNNGIFPLNVKNDWYAQKLRKEKSLPDWRARMAINFFQDYEAANVFSVSVSGRDSRINRTAKEAVKQQDDDWVIDMKKLIKVESVDEIVALKQMIEVIIDNIEKEPRVVISFCNEYDKNGRIYLGMSIRTGEEIGQMQEIDVPEAQSILANELSGWQKRFAKELRRIGRYSMSVITANALYGPREMFRMLA